MGIGAAVAAGTAVAGIGGALISSNAAKSAASTQANAADQASQNALAQYQQTRTDLQPYRDAGQTGLGALQSTLGLGGGGPNLLSANGINGLAYQPSSAFSSVLANPTFAPTQAQLSATPGYQFDLAQGLQATQNSNAASGRGISGAALKGAASYATGLANNTLGTQAGIFQNNYQNALTGNSQGQSIFQSNLGNVLNPLQNLSQLGENASVQTGQQGIQAVQNANALQVGGANAQAAGTVGSANAASSALGSLGSTPLNYALYSQLLSGGNDPNSIPGGGTGMVPGGQGGGALYGNSV